MKKKGFLVLLFALICLVSVGCGKDDDDDKKSSKKPIHAYPIKTNKTIPKLDV